MISARTHSGSMSYALHPSVSSSSKVATTASSYPRSGRHTQVLAAVVASHIGDS
jgi:hypothetical protein